MKGKMSPKVNFKKESMCSFCKKNGYMKKQYAKFHKWLENKGTPISFVCCYESNIDILLDMLKGTYFIFHLITLELWNQEMQSLLKIMISGSDQIRNMVSKKNYSESQPSILSVIVWLLFIASF